MNATTEHNSFKERFDAFLHEAFENERSKLYGAISNFMVIVILYSIATIVMETVGDYETRFARFFRASEWVVIVLFGLEYAGNVYVSKPKRKYALSLWGIIDIVAIVPSLIQVADFRGFKIARILRVLRFLRLMRILKLAKVVADEYDQVKEQKYGTLKMDLQIYFITLFAALTICSTLVYYAESGVEGTLFTDIPSSMWWGIVTMTTVGYGDMYPVTLVGRIVAGMTGLVGLVLFALLMQVVGKAVLQGLFGSEEELEDQMGESDVADATIDLHLRTMPPRERMAQLLQWRDQELMSTAEFEEKRRQLIEEL